MGFIDYVGTINAPRKDIKEEDDSRIRRENAAEHIATARRFALNLARLHPKKDSMRGKLKQAICSDEFRH